MKDLKHVTPESEGISSTKISEFLEYIKETRYNLQGFMILKSGNIVAEGYYKPFEKSTKRRLYSCSKTIAALAVGKLIGEGLARLDAPLVSYFPECIDPDPVMAEITLEDALTMTVPQTKGAYSADGPGPNDVVVYSDWTKVFFSGKNKSIKPHGRLFRYNSNASYVLGDLVKHLTGKDFLEYLRPELDKIGVSRDITCVRSPDGVEWASSGVLCTLEDFARIGLLLLNKGEYCGEQLLPLDYMERATSKRIDTRFAACCGVRDHGYGYQVWIEPYGFGMHGMRGQVAFCFPEKNMLFVAVSNQPEYLDKIYYGASRIYKSAGPEAIPENKAAHKRLCEELSGLTVDRSFGEAHSPMESEIGGKTYLLDENAVGISQLRLDFSGDEGSLLFVMGGVEKELRFGMGRYKDTLFPETDYYDDVITRPSGRKLRALVTASWTSENRLMIISEICDTNIGALSTVLEFYDGNVAIEMTPSAEAMLGEYKGIAIGKQI